MRLLIIIPARQGSKGLPDKNIKLLAGKPLIAYSIEYALKIKGPDDLICISTNDDRIIKISSEIGVNVSFKRPEYLCSDEAGTRDVLLHAIAHYEALGELFDVVLLLQPTSPIRREEYLREMLKGMTSNTDMVVSVRETKDNPYFNLFEENKSGYLEKSKKSDYIRRQDAPSVFAFNGSMYLIRISSLKESGFDGFSRVRKFIMAKEYSVDIDTMEDFELAESYLIK